MATCDEIIAYCNVEKEMITEFVKANPYFNYKTIINDIYKLTDKTKSDELFDEYGKYNHYCCKIIYENPNNKELIIKMGKYIYNRGGKQALVNNYRIITNFTPCRLSTNNIIRSAFYIVGNYFSNVCDDWKC